MTEEELRKEATSTLEKEITELKTEKIPQLERKIASIRGAHSVDCKKLNARLEQVKRLKKENAELKKKNLAIQDAVTMQIYTNKANKEIADKQLTKAKEVINIAIEGIKYWGFVDGTERPFIKQAELTFNLFLDRAEQFLKEVSE